MVINCNFKYINFDPCGDHFTCFVENQQLPENKDLEFNGRNFHRNTTNMVTCVKFINCNITKVPNDLTNIFQNLKILAICSSKLKKISKEDLAEYKNLEQFLCRHNELEFLPGDLFDGFNNLNHITFFGNKLKVIEPNILDGLTKLKHVGFQENVNYDCYYTTYPMFVPRSTLDELKNELYEKFYKRFKFLENMKKSHDNLNQEVLSLRKLEEQYIDSCMGLSLTVDKLNKNIRDLQNSEKKLKQEWSKQQATQPQSQVLNDLSLASDIKAFIHDKTTKDFKIIIEGQEFPVHKFLLAARSPTLAEILKNNPEVENLNLVDISVEIFETILKFLYTDELPVSNATNFMHLFAAAGKLKIEKLVKYAAIKILDQINPENALTIFSISGNFGLNDLKQKSFNLVKKKYKSIKLKDQWIRSPEMVVNIINKFKKKEEALKEFEEEMETLAFLGI